jgi:hypothetical protein
MTAYRSVVLATVPPVLLLFTSDFRPTPFFESYGWLTLHRAVASEPLFTALFAIGLLALVAVFTGPPTRASRALIVAAGASTAAVLVRYVGVALVLSAIVALVTFDRKRNFRARLRRAGMFSAIAVLPTVAFVGWAVIRGSTGPRQLFFRPFASSARLPFEMFARYLFPPGGPNALRIVGSIVVLLTICVLALLGPKLVGVQPQDDAGARLLAQIALLSIGLYVLVVVATRTFLDVTTPIDARLLAPIRGVLYAVVVAVAYRALAPVTRRAGAVAIIAVLAALVVVGGWSQQRPVLERPAVRPASPNPMDDEVRRAPRDLIVSNRPDFVYERTGRTSLPLPSRRVYSSNERNPAYERELQQLARIVENRRGAVLRLSDFPRVAAPAELRRYFDLRLIAQSPASAPSDLLYLIFARSSPP